MTATDYIATHSMVKEYLAKALADDAAQQRVSSETYARVKSLLQDSGACLIAHYYVDAELQRLAEETGGFVGDSLEMARFGAKHPAQTLIVAGVSFMAETAKILSPEKRVWMPTREATCSLDLGCPIEDFERFCEEHPERTVVVYANTSAAVKARADWVVTSSIGLQVVEMLDRRGERILWAPDRYLGHYIQTKTGADMVLWNSACVVHEEFRLQDLDALQALHPEAGLLVHPESPQEMVLRADAVGSTSQLIAAAEALPHNTFIVATDKGIFYKMQQRVPHKLLIEAPTRGAGGSCQSCAHCPWMAMNGFARLEHLLTDWPDACEAHIDETLLLQARRPLDRMLAFTGAA